MSMGEAPLEPCVLCHRPLEDRGYFVRDDGWPVCRDCIRGYRMCAHRYSFAPCPECADELARTDPA